jgi:DNA-binding protein H-NS
MALKTMPIAKLQQLKSQVEAAITAKVTERRRELETELSKLAGFGGRGKATKLARGGRRGPVAPKYRNPENAAETWAGRGLKPRWLAAAIKGRRYFRKRGCKAVPLPGTPGSAEFMDAYRAALGEPAPRVARQGPGTVGALICDYLQSPAFSNLRRRPEIDESGRIVMSGGDSQRAERCILWVHDR